MDQDLSQQDELSARREAMRERLRLKADRVLEAVEQIEEPKTFLEVERAARAIIATDKMIIQIFSAPKSVSFDMRFGAADYGDEQERSSRMPVDRTRNSENSLGNAPSERSALTSPLRYAKGEDEVFTTTNIENNVKNPVSGRLTKRQKRRQRAFKAQTPTVGHGSGLSP